MFDNIANDLYSNLGPRSLETTNLPTVSQPLLPSVMQKVVSVVAKELSDNRLSAVHSRTSKWAVWPDWAIF